MAALLCDTVLAYLPLGELLKISKLSKEHSRIVREHTQTKTALQIPYDTNGIRTNLSALLPNAQTATLDIGARYVWTDIQIPTSVTHLTILLDNSFLLSYGKLCHQTGQNFQALDILQEKLEAQELRLTHLEFRLSNQTSIVHIYKTGLIDKWYGEYEETTEYDHQMIGSIDPINFWYYSDDNQEVYAYLQKFSQMIDACPTLQSCSLPDGFPREHMERHEALLSFTPNDWVDKETVRHILLDIFKDSFVCI